MPLGWERLNERVSRPNEHIVFIKPLPGPDEATSKDFLERVAAICVPIMKANTINVVSLAEHEPNREFLGRNFNNGEVIELVLKSHSGRWLSFQCVQMVMMHELAHCKQMNHSKDFWAVRNQYCNELRVLWSKGYVGEGLWGRGQPLSGQYSVANSMPNGEIPENLCGGGFRSRGSKRKRKERPKKSYAERKEARVVKKFGKAGAGVKLGGDLGARGLLEKGKKVGYGDPRGAQTKRSRELRAQAVLARMEQAKHAVISPGDGDDVRGVAPDNNDEVKTESETESETGSETDDEEDEDDAVDINGKKILDTKGCPMVRVCDDEDVRHDPNAQNELAELGHLEDISTKKGGKSSRGAKQIPIRSTVAKRPATPLDEADISTASEDEEIDVPKTTSRASVSLGGKSPSRMDTMVEKKRSEVDEKQPLKSFIAPPNPPSTLSPTAEKPAPLLAATAKTLSTKSSTHSVIPAPIADDTSIVCPVCSLENDAEALICMACSNVLDLENMPNHWYCKSMQCRGGVYANHGDSGLCGLCGTLKPAV